MPSLDPARLQLAARHLVLLNQLLCQYVPQSQVWAYGSRVSGGAHEGSDLDLVLRNPPDLSVASAGRMDLIDALQESALPMLVDVHDWAHVPREFHSNIERAYVELQPGHSDAGASGR